MSVGTIILASVTRIRPKVAARREWRSYNYHILVNNQRDNQADSDKEDADEDKMKITTSMKSDGSSPATVIYHKYRYMILALCTAAALLEYATRTNINNAIVSMVLKSDPNNNSSSAKSFVSDFCPIPKSRPKPDADNGTIHGFVQDEQFDWDPTTQVIN